MNPLLCFVRARLQRRLFVWFSATILFTALAVGAVMGGTNNGESSWRREVARVQAFIGGRFERVWDEPAERDELARAIGRDLDAKVALEGPDHAKITAFHGGCPGGALRTTVMRDGHPLGFVAICADRYAHRPWRAILPLGVLVLLMWAASGKIAGRLSRPIGELARVANELGSGNLSARVNLGRRHHHGEMAALAITMNDMASRIERNLRDHRELLAAVSHEIRTPLARIRLLTEMARDQGASQKTLDDLDGEVVEIDALVGDLLASSRIDFGVLSRRPIDAVEAASAALERTGSDAAALVVDDDEGLGRVLVQADATLLGRALANLIDNAKKHGSGVETLRVRRSAGKVSIEVEDRGEGFAEGDEDRVFEPFYRRSENGSLGLGLALVKRIAEAHGGRAYAANREGGGARVGVELPEAVG